MLKYLYGPGFFMSYSFRIYGENRQILLKNRQEISGKHMGFAKNSDEGLFVFVYGSISKHRLHLKLLHELVWNVQVDVRRYCSHNIFWNENQAEHNFLFSG